MSKKLFILGAYGSKNFGDDLLMYTVTNILKANGLLDISSFVSTDICSGKHFNRITSEIDVNCPDMLNNIDFSQSIFIYGGGTQFFSFDSNLKAIYNILSRIFMNRKKIKFLLNSKVANFNFFLGIGIGPFKNIFYPLILRRILRNYNNYIYVRDKISYNYIKRWGVRNSFLGADLIFSSKFVNSINLTTVEKKSLGEIRKIGVVIRDWNYDKYGMTYILNILKLEQIMSDKYEFIYFIYKKSDKKSYNIISSQSRKLIVWDPDIYSMRKFIEIHSSCDLIITARFHGAIIAALLGVPFIPIGLEPKLNQVLKSYYGEAIKVWVFPYSVESLNHLINVYRNMYSKIKENIIYKNRGLQQLADAMIADFIKRIYRCL